MGTNTDVERSTAEAGDRTIGAALERAEGGASMPALRADAPAAAKRLATAALAIAAAPKLAGKPPRRTPTLCRAWTAAQIAAQAGDRVRELLRNFPGASVIAVAHAGILAEPANDRGGRPRRHRLHVLLLGQRAAGQLVMPSLSTIELQIALRWNRAAGEFEGHLVRWRVAASQGAFRDGGSLLAALRRHLDAPRRAEAIVFRLRVGEGRQVALRLLHTEHDGSVSAYYQLSRAR